MYNERQSSPNVMKIFNSTYLNGVEHPAFSMYIHDNYVKKNLKTFLYTQGIYINPNLLIVNPKRVCNLNRCHLYKLQLIKMSKFNCQEALSTYSSKYVPITSANCD